MAALWQQNLDRAVALCSRGPGADVEKRQVGGTPQDHQCQDRYRRPPTNTVRRASPRGPRR
jgi:hypothetical protein